MSTIDFTDLSPIAVETFVRPDEVAKAIRITQLFPDATLGGSFIVLGYAAHDVDVFMNWDTWRKVITWLTEQGQEVIYKNHKLSDYKHDAGYALLTVADWGQVQFIVIKDEYMPAYEKCAELMNKDPHLFQDKADRIALHRVLRYLCTTGDITKED